MLKLRLAVLIIITDKITFVIKNKIMLSRKCNGWPSNYCTILNQFTGIIPPSSMCI